MKAAFLYQAAGPEGLVFGEIPEPVPARGEVLVQVHATAATPTEFKWFPTFNTREGKPRAFPIVPSHEFSGAVAAIGAGVTGLKLGDEVYGLNDWFANGALSEYCIAPAAAVAIKPTKLTHASAAVAPISALTAWQGLFEKGKLEAGQTVLIHGGSGGVGVFSVQLARWRGARVIATASTHNLEFVRELGADEVIDYKTTHFEDSVRNVDHVFDTVGGETLNRSWAVIRPGGKVVTVATQSETTPDQRARDAFFIVEANSAQLTEIARLFDAGTLRAFVAGVFPFTEAHEAYARAARGNQRGKIVLQIRPE